jgi:diacylglycerol kinase family enzyme
VGIEEAPALDRNRLVAITAKPLGILSSLRLMLRGFLGRLGAAPEVSSFAFETLTVQVGRRGRRSRVKVATDGEIVYLRPPLVFRPSPHALQLIVPAAPPEEGDGVAARHATDAIDETDGAGGRPESDASDRDA